MSRKNIWKKTSAVLFEIGVFVKLLCGKLKERLKRFPSDAHAAFGKRLLGVAFFFPFDGFTIGSYGRTKSSSRFVQHNENGICKAELTFSGKILNSHFSLFHKSTVMKNVEQYLTKNFGYSFHLSASQNRIIRPDFGEHSDLSSGILHDF